MSKRLRCIKCTTDNVRSAKFCKKCGYEFSDGEREAAKKWTLVWVLEGIEKVMSLWKFKFITDHILFKIASVVVVLLAGIYFWITNGVNLKLEKSERYSIQYNEETSDFYLLTTEEKTVLDLYVPNRARSVFIKRMNQDGEIDRIVYQPDVDIVLEAKGEDEYYLIEAKYEKNNMDQIKLYVFREVEE